MFADDLLSKKHSTTSSCFRFFVFDKYIITFRDLPLDSLAIYLLVLFLLVLRFLNIAFTFAKRRVFSVARTSELLREIGFMQFSADNVLLTPIDFLFVEKIAFPKVFVSTYPVI